MNSPAHPIPIAGVMAVRHTIRPAIQQVIICLSGFLSTLASTLSPVYVIALQRRTIRRVRLPLTTEIKLKHMMSDVCVEEFRHT
ncbi:hypothetical protein JOF56_009213 [Kibdelosporangium banguiense]|uniref:Uncharacterized protein n=1 Tax=Kibdelosporangium banguiense TaxID=1365924 RepID=A0ABS4TWT3_9PSEU|nr:hypothetical protein [Kibdelosporangium banguiense]